MQGVTVKTKVCHMLAAAIGSKEAWLVGLVSQNMSPAV
jgi:hypothetical protein